MGVLLPVLYFTMMKSVADIPESGELVHDDSTDHCRQSSCIYFQEQSHQERHARFPKHAEREKSFANTRGMFDVGILVPVPIQNSRPSPKWNKEAQHVPRHDIERI